MSNVLKVDVTAALDVVASLNDSTVVIDVDGLDAAMASWGMMVVWSQGTSRQMSFFTSHRAPAFIFPGIRLDRDASLIVNSSIVLKMRMVCLIVIARQRSLTLQTTA